jgi:hypothetical protein
MTPTSLCAVERVRLRIAMQHEQAYVFPVAAGATEHYQALQDIPRARDMALGEAIEYPEVGQ